MVGCNECDRWFYTDAGLEIHKAKKHRLKSNYVPDLIGLGVIKRELTQKESKQITEEVMSMGLSSFDARFTMTIIKAIEVTNKGV